MNNIYYVYALIDPRTGLPFYVGKGKNDRMQSHLDGTATGGIKKYNRIAEIRAAGYEPVAVKLEENLFEEQAYEIEEYIIRTLGREEIEENGILTNNRIKAWAPIQTSDIRKAISEARIGMQFTEEHRENLSKSRRGKSYEEIYGEDGAKKRREQLAENRGPHTEERNKNISDAKTGMNAPHNWSAESRKKLSDTVTGVSKNLSDEERKRRSEVVTEEVTCTYCNKEGSRLSMLRWHFENCKERKNAHN